MDRYQAQLLMSQLLDGELSSRDAARLRAYLERHPDDMDWMEGLEAGFGLGTSASLPPGEKEAGIAAITRSLASREAVAALPAKDKLLRFPQLMQSLAAAAALVAVGIFTWTSLDTQPPTRPEPAVVEFVATGIPDASTYVYSDEESGWTVVWVESGRQDSDHG